MFRAVSYTRAAGTYGLLTLPDAICRFWKRIGPTLHAKDVEARVAQRQSMNSPAAAPIDSVTLPPKAGMATY
jgi:hypothetical protein